MDRSAGHVDHPGWFRSRLHKLEAKGRGRGTRHYDEYEYGNPGCASARTIWLVSIHAQPTGEQPLRFPIRTGEGRSRERCVIATLVRGLTE